MSHHATTCTVIECDGRGCPEQWLDPAVDDPDKADELAQADGWRVLADGRHLCFDCAAKAEADRIFQRTT